MYNTHTNGFNKRPSSKSKPSTAAGSRPANSTRIGTNTGTRAIGSAVTRGAAPRSSGGPGSVAGGAYNTRQPANNQSLNSAMMLQQQVPAPGIPRFNPHGYQAPPQEKKREERPMSYRPMAARQKVQDDAPVDFKKFNIEDLLSDMNLEFRNPTKAPGGWLPLDCYDNKELDTKAPADWMKKPKSSLEKLQTIEEEQKVTEESQISKQRNVLKEVGAQGLWQDRDGLCFWRRLKVTKFLKGSEKYQGYWENTKEVVKLPRISILFDGEDPRLFAKRFADAYKSRTMADSLLKYNFYIENMPVSQIPEIEDDKVNRVLRMVQNSKSTRGRGGSDTTTLLSEVNFDFAKTMNKIVFDKHIDKDGPMLISGPLVLPEPKQKEIAPLKGMINIPHHNFPEQFSNLCFASLLNKDASIKAMQEIRKECNDVMLRDIYNHAITKSMRVSEFKQIQKSSTSQISYYCKETWLNKIKEIIQTNFTDEEPGWVGTKPWYSLKVTDRKSYQEGKLKKFLTQTKFVMEDSLYFMTKGSVKRYVNSICDFVPISCEVINSFQVKNTFYSEETIRKLGPQREKIPLFSIDLTVGEDRKATYSSTAQEVVQLILSIFDTGIKSLQEISQVEQKLLQHLFKSNEKSFLKATVRPEYRPEEVDPDNKRDLPDTNTWVFDEYDRLRACVMNIIDPLNEYCKTYDSFAEEIAYDPDLEMSQYDDMDPVDWPEVEVLKQSIVLHQQREKELETEIPEEIICSIFKISTKVIRDTLMEKRRRIASRQIEFISKIAKHTANKILDEFDIYNTKCHQQPKDMEQLAALKEFMQNLPKELEKQRGAIKKCMTMYDILDKFHYKFSEDEEYEKMWKVYGAPIETIQTIDKQQSFLEKEKEKFVRSLEVNKKDFDIKITEIESLVGGFKAYQDGENYQEVAGLAKEIKQRIDDAIENANLINRRQRLAELDEETDYTTVTQMNKDFMPYYNLWTTVEAWMNKYDGWINGPFEELDSVDVDETAEHAKKTMSQVMRFFRDKELPGIMKIADGIKQKVDEFMPHVPLVLALRTEGMVERHWELLSEKLGKEIKPYEGFTFSKIMEMDLLDRTDEIVDVGERAGKEYQIECGMNKMKQDWTSIELTLKPFKKTGTYVVSGFDDAMQILDEHIVITQTMMFSPFRMFMLEDIEDWNKNLLYISECIDEWLKCQGQWTYLQPIFDSPDIVRQLPSENKKFKSVDKNWKLCINGTIEDPNTLNACTREGLLETFLECNQKLEVVQKGLRDYLESKRAVFARFFFLSNDELLEILSETKEVEKVRPHLRKVFENLVDVTFMTDKTIVEMFSGEKEKIEFVEPVDPKDKGVEFWMGDLETMMYKTVRHVLKFSIDNYIEIKRTEWCLKHPGQCVLNGSQIYWTSEVEDALKQKKLPDCLRALESQLLETVELVRGKMSKLQSITMGALITIDVHAKDVIKTLVKEKITNLDAFEWISQLRYYWEDKNMRVKCIQTNFPYGYEYLGNTFRLVITPLTDKCYMTLMGALALNLGGAPAGPAGTGKTETTKDLAKALAKQCVVFNCSDGMDYIMIGKFFKGLAASGAWSCFDEFNRINLEVLSVIASQLQQLFAAKAAGTEEIIFEESVIKLIPTFCSFITMNPGYAGRSELPDNLKALFRPVAMMVPDYSLIAAISLYSFGYATADVLSVKMVTTFTLNSEQLSAQCHYDYGMRAVKSVINAAGLLKRQDPDMAEDQLLLRALRDVNVPKFLAADLPLFENIITDLFPGVERPNIDYGALLVQMKQSCIDLNLAPTENFLAKIIQLYDTIQVRHGLMLVGPTGGGKTMNYKTLAHSMTQIKHMEKFEKVKYFVINPKSITQGQLYGDFYGAGEWEDGIIAKVIQDCAKDESPDKNWVMFDGPVDAIWIENMNTVLDDNKKLCLNSGQIINLTDRMTMMFEVEDLTQASPATVSRCGMVYMEPDALGNDPLIKCWLNTIPDAFKKRKGLSDTIYSLFKKYMNEMLKFMRKNMKEPVFTVDNNVVQSFCRILDCYFADFIETEIKKVTQEDVEAFEQSLEQIFLFALTWSIGATTNLEGRDKFNQKLKLMMSEKLKFPSDLMVYDCMWNTKNLEWVKWTDTVDAYHVDSKLSYDQIVVPTFDSIRMQYVTRLLLTNKKHVLCPGPTGTGKTVNIQKLLEVLPEEYQYIPITFSAQTSANQVQEALDEKFEKRRKGIYGPPTGKRFVIFIDDLNMPKKETYGAQPPIEILRQWMDHKGWYDRTEKSKPFKKIEDIIFVSAMGPPGGGRVSLSQRMQRHFNFLTYTNLGKDSIQMIFSKIIKAFVSGFSEKISEVCDGIVESTQIIFNGVANKLRPTPSKSHYTFNLRDISKVFQGVCSADSKENTEPENIFRLWIHENQRVFGDRMINNQDKQLLLDLILEECAKFNLKKEQLFNVERILYGDYFNGIEGDQRPYVQIHDTDILLTRIDEYLQDYNGGVKVPMELVMFLDACEHVSRICRILRQPLGNALLLGVGGSGRQSLTKLSTFMNSYKIYQIEVVKGYSMRDWRDNLKFALMQAGVDGKITTFLFVDTQIINEQQLEDLNNVLNSGDVPQLYKAEDFEGIYNCGKTECQRKGLQLNKMNMFGQYLLRVKGNTHCVIAMSPLGDIFRQRLLKFPSFVNCCTIDWFSNWPEQALMSVGRGSISHDQTVSDILGEDLDSCIEMFKIIHQSVEDISLRYREEMRRISYVTPTSFLELLSTYKKTLLERRKYIGGAKSRLEKGLNVLANAAVEVDKLKNELIAKKPELERVLKEVAEKKVIIDKENKEAQEVKKVVSVQEDEASTQAAEVKKIKDDADADLAVALPALEQAVKKVKEIDVKDFYELRTIGKPSQSIVKMFEVVSYMLKLSKPPKNKDEKSKDVDPDGYFIQAKKELLVNPKDFLRQLIEYDKDNIQEALVLKVKPLMTIDALTEKAIANASKALVPVRIWVQAMITYSEVLKIVNPKRAIAAEMTAKLEVVMKNLNEKRAIVKEINDKLAKLSAEQQALEAKSKELNDDIEECGKRLIRAEKMINGLAGEKDRWTTTVADLSIQLNLVVGDSLIASGAISYSGAYTSIYREELEETWRTHCEQLNIKFTKMITMSKVLGNDVTIRQWGVAGLPSDKLSVENGIIMFKSRRWPLMIDPQTQANKFVKNMGKDPTEAEAGLDICKQSESNLLRSLELAIQFGKWVLLENIGESLDPALEPILLQQKIKSGSSFVIKLGDKNVPYNENFKFFLTTTLPNPHYTPETQVKISLLNFAITPFGLEEQMLNMLVALEFPDLQAQKEEIIMSNAKNTKITYDLENKILHTLSAAEEIMDLLKDDNLIDILADSKKISTEIDEQKQISDVAEKEIDETREAFRNVAFRASLLFFCIVDLSSVDPMYQYSLQWFQRLFTSGVKQSEPEADKEKRAKILNDYFTLQLYRNICRSLFEAHKLLFSFMLCTKILFGNNEIDLIEWRFFLAGPSGQIEEKPNPTDWLDDIEWKQTYEQLFVMGQMEAFKGIDSYFIEFHKKFKKIFDAVEAHEEKMPGEWEDRLNSFQKMIVLKSLRADKITAAIQNFITEKIGKEFIEPPVFDLMACYNDSSQVSPLIFVLSAGTDPVADFRKLAEESGMLDKIDLVSLGQGQAKYAEAAIEKAKMTGGWCLLQNCHLSISWMPKLEAIVEGLNEQMNQEFRIWLTSMPSPNFPVSVLQTSVKMTLEPPSGLKSNLMRTYANIDNKSLNDCSKPDEYKKLLFAYSLFHAIIQGRRKFGAIGWNIPYAFMNEDMAICQIQLKQFLDDYDIIPYKVLNFLNSAVNYGGRVTDDKDIRLIDSIQRRFINEGCQEVGYGFSASGTYCTIEAGTRDDYISYINSLPLVPKPEAFGMHDNAEITTNQNDTRIILELTLSVQPRTSSGGGVSREDQIDSIAKMIQSKTPAVIDLDEVSEKYPTEYTESMNTVLCQEIVRYNALLSVMVVMLRDVQKALVGELVMSEELEVLATQLYDNQVPQAFSIVGPLSLKPLSSWINDINDRLDFINKWIVNGKPPAYWISGFFFPQAFFTGAMQNYARKHVVAIDQLSYDYKVYDEIDPADVTESPEDGVFCFGIYIEGARWNKTIHMLDESKPKVLYVEMPLIWYVPKKNRQKPDQGTYNCPVYKVLSRTGTLSTTGHSTNFVHYIELPTKDDPENWIRGGVAAFLALRY